MPKTSTKQRKSLSKPYCRPNRRRNIEMSLESSRRKTNELDEDDLLKSDSESVKSTNSTYSANEEVMKLLLDIKRDQCTKKDLDELNTNIDNKFKLVNSQLNKHTKQIDKLNSRLATVERGDHNPDIIQSISARLDVFENKALSTQHDMELNKQKLLRNNLSIMGIPFSEGEDLKNIAITIFKKLDCTPTNNTIDSCYRINGKGQTSNLFIVKLTDYDFKQQILANKTKKSMKVKDIVNCVGPSADNIVYINNHVTPHFGKLLSEGRRAVKIGNVFSVWISSHGTQLKFDENGKHFVFYSVDHLQQLIRENPKEKLKTSKRNAPDDTTQSPTLSHKTKSKKKISNSDE